MFKDKYPLIYEISQLIKTNKPNAKQYIKNIISIEQITSSDSNTIIINDYQFYNTNYYEEKIDFYCSCLIVLWFNHNCTNKAG